MIKLKEVTKEFSNELKALTDITFDIAEGEIVYILGESGSGKSTLLNIIAGLEDADHGSVHVNDAKITGPEHNLVPGYRSIARVPQDFKLQAFLTVEDNLRKMLSGYSEEYKTLRISELLDLCELSDKAGAFPKELSGGQQQRISIAVNLAHEPDVVLLDEPFSNLDLQLKRSLHYEIMTMLKSIGTTVLVVSHDPSEALAAADRIMLIREGSILQFDAPEKIYNQPNSEYVARFLGPINVVNNENTLSLLRPKNFTINPSGKHKGIVTQCLFQGSCYHVYIKAKIGKSDLLIYSNDPLELDSNITFDFSH